MLATSCQQLVAQPLQCAAARTSCQTSRCRMVVHASEDKQSKLRWSKGAALGAVIAAGLALTSVDGAYAAGIRVKGFPGGGSTDELSEKYMQGADKKKLQYSRRKEALAKRREEALKSGGATAAPADGEKKEDPKVTAANAEVDRSNAEREKFANEQLMASIRSKASGYDGIGSKSTGRLQ